VLSLSLESTILTYHYSSQHIDAELNVFFSSIIALANDALVESPQRSIMRTIIERRLDDEISIEKALPESQPLSCWLALHWATTLGDKFSCCDIRDIMDQDPLAVYATDSCGATAAHFAAGSPSHNKEVIELLSDLHPRLSHKKDHNGWQMLHYAVAYSTSTECLELVHQLNPSATRTKSSDDDGSTPLHLVASRDCFEEN
jgi:ankyrin repeat protein